MDLPTSQGERSSEFTYLTIRRENSRLEHPRHCFLDFFFFFWSHFTLKNNLVGFKLLSGDSLVAQLVKNLPAMQETIRFLGREDALEKETATHSSILAWRIPWTEEPGKLQSMGSKESNAT